MRIASYGLVAWLGLGSSICLVSDAIAPNIAQAYTSRVNVILERQPNESYDTLVRRAEAVARAAAQRSFDNDILATEAEIIITGQHIGLSAPILTLTVNRENWRSRPDARRWSTYYPNSKQLLRIDDPVVAATPPQGRQRPEPTLGTGVIQSTLRWSTTDDLDLEIIDPRGERVFFQNKRVASGGQLDVDSNANCQDTITNPVENIFWPQTGAPPGNYVVKVNLYQRCATQSGAIPFRLRLLVEGREQNITESVDDSKKTFEIPFTLGGGATPAQPAAPGNAAPAAPAAPATPATPAIPATPATPAAPANPRSTQPSTSPRPVNRAREVQQQINNRSQPAR